MQCPPHASVAPLRGMHSRLCRVRGKGRCRKVLGCRGGLLSTLRACYHDTGGELGGPTC